MATITQHSRAVSCGAGAPAQPGARCQRAAHAAATRRASGSGGGKPGSLGSSSSTGGASKLGGGLGSGVPAQHSFARRQQVPPPQPPSGGGNSGSCTIRGAALYSAALNLARTEQFEAARRVFEAAVSECPFFEKAWVSWAQMEKRCMPRGDANRFVACRTVLQRGLLCNPNAPALLQAWGLMEMQRGNWLAAVLLLDRSARLEPRNMPVLRWKPVVEARKTVGERQRRSSSGSSAAGASSCSG